MNEVNWYVYYLIPTVWFLLGFLFERLYSRFGNAHPEKLPCKQNNQARHVCQNYRRQFGHMLAMAANFQMLLFVAEACLVGNIFFEFKIRTGIVLLVLGTICSFIISVQFKKISKRSAQGANIDKAILWINIGGGILFFSTLLLVYFMGNYDFL
ncbi:MAG: hypothetical protein KAR42_10610 [candidate division Zixibacteria bacterium]|nr:hypothetical protein [candidate division Zixibacteria bacterium]